MTEKSKKQIDIADAIAWIECSVEIFYDEPVKRKENMKNLLRFLEALTQEDIDRAVWMLEATQ